MTTGQDNIGQDNVGPASGCVLPRPQPQALEEEGEQCKRESSGEQHGGGQAPSEPPRPRSCTGGQEAVSLREREHSREVEAGLPLAGGDGESTAPTCC